MANQVEFGGSVDNGDVTGLREEYDTSPFIANYGLIAADGNEVFGGSESELPE